MTRAVKPRQPQTAAQAAALLAEVAALDGQIASHEAERRTAIAATDAAADALVAPMAARRAAISAVLEPWWLANAATLTDGKRKSIDLGGCNVGTRKAAERVEFSGGDDKAALAAVAASPHRGAATALKRVLDKTAIAKLLAGKGAAGAALRALGFSLAGGQDVFFIKRIDSGDAKAAAR